MSYAPIRPLKVILKPSTGVLIKVTEFQGIPAGGFTIPLNIFLDKGPMVDLTVGMYQLGTTPDKFGIFPGPVTFLPGEKLKYVWLSTDHASKGSTGSVVLTLTGTERAVYSLPVRNRSFFVYTPRTEKPVIVTSSIVGPIYENNVAKTSKIQVTIKTNVPTIVYFGIVPGGTLDLKISEIRAKKLRYDNFYSPYFLGEAIQNSVTYETTFEIKNIDEAVDSYLKIFVQNGDGNYASPALQYNFTTEAVSAPGILYLKLPQSHTESNVLAQIKTLMSAASALRLTSINPDATNYFEVTDVDGVVTFPATSLENITDTQTSDLEDEISLMEDLKSQWAFLSNSEDTFSTSASTGSTTTGTSGTRVYTATDIQTTVSATDQSLAEAAIVSEYNILHQNRIDLDPAIDHGMTANAYSTMEALVSEYQSRTINYLKIGNIFFLF